MLARITSLRYEDLWDLPWSVWSDLAVMADAFVASLNSQPGVEVTDG